jgi:hypothetical protein
MKRTSTISAILVSIIALSVPAIAWSQIDPNISSHQNIADAIALNHHSSTYGSPYHGGHGRHGGCW